MRYVLFVSDNNKLATRVRDWLRWYGYIGGLPILVTSEPWNDTLTDAPLWGLSVGYRHIFKPATIERFDRIVNLHTGYLPYNRGSYPNVWPILDGSPAGVTLHEINAGIDTGPIITQTEIDVEPWDTALSLYWKLEDEAFQLFTDWWDVIRTGEYVPVPQDLNVGSTHRKADLVEWDTYKTTAETALFLDHLRARTFEGYPGVIVDGEYEVTVNVRRV